MWKRSIDGLTLTFHLAGINNQNFLMRDEQTGSFWQQISGKAIAGPMTGRQLDPVASDELTFRLWKSEQPRGTVLNDVKVYAGEYAPKDWDVAMRKVPTVMSYAGKGLHARDLMLGIELAGASRAFPVDRVLREKLVKDRVAGEPVLLIVGPDDQSVRVFRDRIPGVAAAPDFYRTPSAQLIDSATGSEWNFLGCAVSGKAKGACLERLSAIKDYWFDWRHYHPQTTVYGAHI